MPTAVPRGEEDFVPTRSSPLPCPRIFLREPFNEAPGSEKKNNAEAAAPEREQSACRGCTSRTPLRGAVACAAGAEQTTRALKSGLGPPEKEPQEEAKT